MELGYWSSLVAGGGSERGMERSDASDDEVCGSGLSRLSLMERSRRVGVVSLESGAGAGKRRLPSPLSPDSAIGGFSDDDARKSAKTDDDDDEDVINPPPLRTLRAPSVVISDYSDETVPCITLEEIERLRAEYESRLSGDDTASECSATSSWSSWGLDPSDYQLRTPQRKTSDCSTCSTLSGDDEAASPVILQEVVVNKKVFADVCHAAYSFKKETSKRFDCMAFYFGEALVAEPRKKLKELLDVVNDVAEPWKTRVDQTEGLISEMEFYRLTEHDDMYRMRDKYEKMIQLFRRYQPLKMKKCLKESIKIEIGRIDDFDNFFPTEDNP